MGSGLPLVSVILCNYNYGRFIAEAIDSVLSQTYANFELIIVDDGSSDGSKQVIRSYGDPRIRTIFQENGGQAAALNSGFERTTGKFIAFLDSDDKWKSEKVAKVVCAFEKDAFSIVQHNLEVIDANSRPSGKLRPGFTSGTRDVLQAYFAEKHTGFFCPTSGVSFRRIDLENIFPLDESWKICADVALTRPMPIFGKVLTLKETLGYYRIHGSNLWMNTDGQRENIEIERRCIEYTNQWLVRYGYTQLIDFTGSAIYERWRLQRLPRYHPRRLWKKAMASSNPGALLGTLFRMLKQ